MLSRAKVRLFVIVSLTWSRKNADAQTCDFKRVLRGSLFVAVEICAFSKEDPKPHFFAEKFAHVR